MQKLLKPIIIILALIIIGVLVMYKINNKPIVEQDNGSAITLYYRTDCPHCQNVEKFLADNKVSEKISFNQKEVGSNSQNASELVAKAKICQLNTNEILVPFLWDGAKCFIGDSNIIDFFKKKMEEANSANLSESCQESQREVRANLTALLDEINYCNSDLDCIDDDSMLTCPFGCQTVLRNKNADIIAIKDAVNKYYDSCPACISDCSNPAPAQADIKCRDKKCVTDKVSPE